MDHLLLEMNTQIRLCKCAENLLCSTLFGLVEQCHSKILSCEKAKKLMCFWYMFYESQIGSRLYARRMISSQYSCGTSQKLIISSQLFHSIFVYSRAI